MKKVIASRFYLVILPFFAVLFLFATASCVTTMAEAAGAGDRPQLLMGIVNFLWCILLALVFLFALNRRCCLVWVEDGAVRRRGLLGGFHKAVPIDDIQNVQIISLRRDGRFICLIDGSSHGFDPLRKDSYICLGRSHSNLEFVRSFWSGEIKEEV